MPFFLLPRDQIDDILNLDVDIQITCMCDDKHLFLLHFMI